MSTHTTNYNLDKPDDIEYVLISDLNGNMDILDSALHAVSVVANTNSGNIITEVATRAAADTALSGRVTILEADSGWLSINPTAGAAPAFVANWAGTIQYRKIRNRVTLRGTASRGASTNTTITTLPVGFRPTQTLNKYLRDNNSATLLNVAAAIGSNGDIIIGNTNYTNTDNITFDGVEFYID